MFDCVRLAIFFFVSSILFDCVRQSNSIVRLNSIKFEFSIRYPGYTVNYLLATTSCKQPPLVHQGWSLTRELTIAFYSPHRALLKNYRGHIDLFKTVFEIRSRHKITTQAEKEMGRLYQREA